MEGAQKRQGLNWGEKGQLPPDLLGSPPAPVHRQDPQSRRRRWCSWRTPGVSLPSSLLSSLPRIGTRNRMAGQGRAGMGGKGQPGSPAGSEAGRAGKSQEGMTAEPPANGQPKGWRDGWRREGRRRRRRDRLQVRREGMPQTAPRTSPRDSADNLIRTPNRVNPD